MALILSIDTATEHASVCLSSDEKILALAESTEQKNHASFVQPAIQQLMNDAGAALTNLDAVAVTAGPGSYTGLRVGMASAKGICYALQKPLILIDTLEVMAFAASANASPGNAFFCPLIDARRMEVFTALYNPTLEEVQPPHALILEPGCFSELLSGQPVVFSGNGSLKLKALIDSPNAIFSPVQHSARHLAARAIGRFKEGIFANLAYVEPLYVKEFFSPAPKSK